MPRGVRAAVKDDGVMELVEHHITITRDPVVKIPKSVYDHELPILNLLEGEENITILESRTVKVKNLDPHAEYERLVRKYAKHENTTAVQQVYGVTAQNLADQLGLDYVPSRGARKAVEIKQSAVVNNETGEEVRELA